MKAIVRQITPPVYDRDLFRDELKLVSELFIRCYDKIMSNYVMNGPQLEDFYRNLLISFAQESKDDMGLFYMYFTSETSVCDESLRTVGRIDIHIINLKCARQGEEKVYLSYECKRLRKNYLNDKYINEGIKRYVCEEKYSRNLPFAGMIGFIEVGEPNKIIKDLNRRLMAHPNHSMRKQLEQRLICEEFDHSYHSEHIREKSSQSIELYHLLFNLNPIIKP